MAKVEHKNLLTYGDKAEVYAALQRDFDRDSWVQWIWRFVFVGIAVGAAVIGGYREWLWIFAGLFALERAVVSYIDNSNRNWAMHVIDWIESDSNRATDSSGP